MLRHDAGSLISAYVSIFIYDWGHLFKLIPCKECEIDPGGFPKKFRFNSIPPILSLPFPAPRHVRKVAEHLLPQIQSKKDAGIHPYSFYGTTWQWRMVVEYRGLRPICVTPRKFSLKRSSCRGDGPRF